MYTVHQYNNLMMIFQDDEPVALVSWIDGAAMIKITSQSIRDWDALFEAFELAVNARNEQQKPQTV